MTVEGPLVEREGKDVGGAVLAHVVEVQALHLGVAGERHLDLAVASPQRRVDGLADRGLQELMQLADGDGLDGRCQLIPSDVLVERDRAAHVRIVGDLARRLKVGG
jgi:hypothetical protein